MSNGIAASDVTVAREGDRAVIREFETLGWDWSQGNSTLRVLALQARAAGHDVSYEHLMGTSAMAFRLQLHDVWCPSSPHICCGWEGGIALVETAAPFQWQNTEVKAADADAVAQARRAIVESVDRGVPVARRHEEDGLIVGYESGGDVLLYHDYFKWDTSPCTPMEQWPWGFGFVRPREDDPDPKAATRAALESALRLWDADQRHGDYDCGRKAWERWIRELKDAGSFAAMDDEGLKGRMLGNAHTYMCLVDARQCAVAYLGAVAKEFDGPARDHLLKARDAYAAMGKDVFGDGCPTAVAPFPQQLAEGQSWRQEQRDGQADVLALALKLEEQAMAALRSALDAM